MAVERYANNATSTLSGSITAASTTLAVNSAADFPTSGQFRILIDSEILLVTSVAGTTFTVQRGVEGTVAAAHNSNATVEHVLTKFSLVGIRSLDARQFGATGDGTTDDTAALQAAIDALADGDYGELFIPAGDYKLTSALVIPAMSYKTIRGADWGVTFLRQYTSNVPVLTTTVENMPAVTIRDLQLVYNTQQTSTDTSGIALAFQATGATGTGWYQWRVQNVRIHQAHAGIGLLGTGSLMVWNCLFERIWMTRISHTAIDLVSPGAGGMPVNVFRDIFINNQGTGITPTGPAIEAQAAELVFDGLDIEGWVNDLIFVSGGPPVTIRGMHIEHHVANAASDLIEVANGALSLHNVSIEVEVTSAATLNLLRVGSNGSIALRQARLDVTLTSGSVVGLLQTTGGRVAHIEDVTDVKNNIPFAQGQIPFIGPFNPILTTNNINPGANQINLYAFTVPRTVRVSKGYIDINSGSGNVDIGIYDDEGNRLASSGTTAMSAGPGAQAINFTASVLLNPGRKYYAAIVVDNEVASLHGMLQTGTGNQSAGTLSIATRVNATYPLPSSLTIAGAGSATKLFPLHFTS